MTKKKQAAKNEALENLRRWIKPGDTVYTVLRSVSASGMSRVISIIVMLPPEKEGDKPGMIHPNRAVATVLGYTLVTKNGHDGLRVGGCGMDMGFSVVYNLAATLWPGGDGKTVTGRNGDKGPETDGGYLLDQKWL